MFTIKLTAKAKRELKKISRQHKESIGLILEELKEDPYIGKPLIKEFIGRLSYKVGTYRIIYSVNNKDKIVTVITAGHRSNIYQ